MNVEAVEFALKAKVDSPTAKLVLLGLAASVCPAGSVELPVSKLAGLLGLNRSTVIRHIRNFEFQGVVYVQRRLRPDGGNLSNVYWFVPVCDQSKLQSLGLDLHAD